MAGGEGKGKKRELSRGRNVTRGIPQHSEVMTTKLFSIKIQIRKLWVGIPGSGLHCGRPHSKRDISSSSILPFLWEKYKRPSLSALSGNYKAFPGTGLKSVYVS